MIHYDKHPKHFVAVDCVIFGYRNEELCLLLYPRGFEPSKGSWSLMGGFVQLEESSEEAARRILKQTTGLENIFLEQVETFTALERDPEALVISISYYSLVRIDEHDEICVREHGAHWWPITNLPDMIFDHGNMVEKALVKLQQNAGYRMVGKELLPEKFTLMQLGKLYESIFQPEFDPGNFRKKILSLGAQERLNVKNFTESKKGAYYFRCTDEKNENGFNRIVKI